LIYFSEFFRHYEIFGGTSVTNVVDDTVETLQAIGIIIISYLVISTILAMIIGSSIQDKLPTDEQVEQCRVDSTAQVPREQWNTAYLTGIYKFCKESLTVPAATRALKISFIVVALGFFGFFLKTIGFFENTINTTGSAKKDYSSNQKSSPINESVPYGQDKSVTSYSLEEVDTILTIVQSNKNKLLRYEAFVAHPMFEHQKHFSKVEWMKRVEAIVRDYIDVDAKDGADIKRWIKNNRAEVVTELQYCLKRGECIASDKRPRWRRYEGKL
jgi:hypothetical protein